MPQDFLTVVKVLRAARRDAARGLVANMDPLSRSDAKRLLRDGWSDEDVERLTGVSLDAIVVLRAEAASAPVAVKAVRVFRPAAPVQASGIIVHGSRSGAVGEPLDGRSPA